MVESPLQFMMSSGPIWAHPSMHEGSQSLPWPFHNPGIQLLHQGLLKTRLPHRSLLLPPTHLSKFPFCFPSWPGIHSMEVPENFAQTLASLLLASEESQLLPSSLVLPDIQWRLPRKLCVAGPCQWCAESLIISLDMAQAEPSLAQMSTWFGLE